MYREVTHGIQIDVEPQYLSEHSNPAAQTFVFAYKITITNLGTSAARLLTRHWVITDGEGRIEEVEGPGVVGKQPLLKPGESFEYSSFCPLTTPTGNMRGSYEMVDEEGHHYAVKVPLFFLRDLKNFH